MKKNEFLVLPEVLDSKHEESVKFDKVGALMPRRTKKACNKKRDFHLKTKYIETNAEQKITTSTTNVTSHHGHADSRQFCKHEKYLFEHLVMSR